MNLADNIVIDWHVFFVKSKLRHWLINKLDPHFQHCYAVRESEGGQFWIKVDFRYAFTDVQILPKIDYPHIRSIDKDAVILSIRAKINPKKGVSTLNIFNCVEQVKALLGIKAFWVITPYQLYRRLVNE